MWPLRRISKSNYYPPCAHRVYVATDVGPERSANLRNVRKPQRVDPSARTVKLFVVGARLEPANTSRFFSSHCRSHRRFPLLPYTRKDERCSRKCFPPVVSARLCAGRHGCFRDRRSLFFHAFRGASPRRPNRPVSVRERGPIDQRFRRPF